MKRVEIEDDDVDIDPYYDDLSHLMDGEDDEGLLQEEEVSDKEACANPIHPSTVGKDQDFPEAPWTDEKALGEIVRIKANLYDLECKLGTMDAGGKKWPPGAVNVKDTKLWEQIKTMRQRLDRLSNEFATLGEPPRSLFRTGGRA